MIIYYFVLYGHENICQYCRLQMHTNHMWAWASVLLTSSHTMKCYSSLKTILTIEGQVVWQRTLNLCLRHPHPTSVPSFSRGTFMLPVQLPVNVPGRQQMIAQVLEFLQPGGRTAWSFRFLISVWLPLGCCSTGMWTCSWKLLAFQINLSQKIIHICVYVLKYTVYMFNI